MASNSLEYFYCLSTDLTRTSPISVATTLSKAFIVDLELSNLSCLDEICEYRFITYYVILTWCEIVPFKW